MYTISFTKEVLKFLKGLEAKPARQVYEKTISLVSDPRPASSTELRGYRGYLRLRVGDFRVIYKIAQDSIHIALIDARTDDEVYRHLDRISLP